MVVIGITGPTGAGKTTALNELEKLGGCIFDADLVYHQLLECNQTLQNELENRFGDMLDSLGNFDRKKLGAVVFHDPKALDDLNRIAHRHVVEELRQRLDQAEREGCPAAAVDAYALFESGCDRICDVTLAVLAPAEVRVGRIMLREGIPKEYARARVNAQRPDSFYRERCNYILVNDCPTPELFAVRARAMFQEILKHTPQ